MGLIRLLLAVSVVVGHANVPNHGWLIPSGLAVQMFFIISGFYMALILNEKYVGPGSDRVFYGNRLLRLGPTYLLALSLPLVIFVTSRWLAGHASAVGQMGVWNEHWAALPTGSKTMLGLLQLTVVGQEWLALLQMNSANWEWSIMSAGGEASAIPAWHFNLVPPAWSLSHELMFYAMAPALVRARLSVQLCLLACACALRFTIEMWKGPTANFWAYFFFPAELPFFLGGALAYQWLRRIRVKVSGRMQSAMGKVSLLAVVALCLRVPPLPAGLSTWAAGILVASALPWLFLLCRKSSTDRVLGELSYPAYLLHWNLYWVATLCMRLLGLDATANPWMFALISCLIVMTAALAVVLLVEKPIDRIRQRLARKVAAAAA